MREICTLCASALLVLSAVSLAKERALAARSSEDSSVITLEPIAIGLPAPTVITHAGDGSGRLFVALKVGVIAIFDGQQVLPAPFLDLRPLVKSDGFEEGLLGLEFHPSYGSNGHFYVSYTDTAGTLVIARYTVSAEPDVADPLSAFLVLTIPQPSGFHAGGALHFGPDGKFYIGAGDGAVGVPPAQDLSQLLGKMLRIDVDGGSPYAIPPDNPFVGMPGARGEIWSLGLRNPWRFSFDRETGDLWIADVGEGRIEEIDFQPAGSGGGENYGWPMMEGSLCFDPLLSCNDGTLALPILEYHHEDGNCAVIGGHRYRGALYPQLDGVYFFGDYCSGRIWGATLDESGSWRADEFLLGPGINTFGEDEAGELYIGAALSDPAGSIFRIVPTFPVFCDIQMSQETYAEGDIVTAQVFRLGNTGQEPLTIEWKVWLTIPGASPSPIVNIGADGSISFPPASDEDFGPAQLFPVTSEAPRGRYALGCRLFDPVTGETFTADVNLFEIQ